MNRLERLYAVNEAIRRSSPNPVSAAHLASQFGVSRRTIERDLNSLRHAGAPLFAERGRLGGHRTLEDPKKVVLTLSDKEVTALIMALAASGPDLPYSHAGRAAVDRLLDVLPDPTRVAVEELRSKVRTQVAETSSLDLQSRQALEAGVQQGSVVNLVYHDRNGTRTERAVDPVGFLRMQDAWLLIGWCHLRNDGRVFRFDRIQTARATSKKAAAHDLDVALGWVPYEIERL